MKKSILANQLRERQYKSGMIPTEIIDSISDDDIIDCYITCSCCGEKSVNEIELIRSINDAVDSDTFLEIICKNNAHLTNK